MTDATRAAEVEAGQQGAGPAHQDLTNDHRRHT